MRIEETKKRHWFKLANRKIKQRHLFDFQQIEYTNGYTCQINFENWDEAGAHNDFYIETLSFKFEGFKGVVMESPAKSLVGYSLIDVKVVEGEKKEEGFKFFLENQALKQAKTIEVWGSKRIYILVED